MRPDNEGFLYPEVDTSKCVLCGICLEVCPVYHKSVQKNIAIESYAARANLNNVREFSSSGGVFYYLAKSIIEKDGVVYGAISNRDMQIEHIAIDRMENVRLACGSKYVQSMIGSTYKSAKEHLESGRQVLFSGTPCQIAGLNNYLGRCYANLLSVDVICHGVPSPLIYKMYLANLEKQFSSKAVGINFRSKQYGWKNYSLRIEFRNGDIYLKPINHDMYLKGFVRDLYNRPSCHNCMYKGINSGSDIKLGDFWNVHKSIPYIDDDKGVSAIIICTKKGRKAYTGIKDLFTTVPTTTDNICKYNSALYQSTVQHKNRAKFFRQLKEHNLADQIEKALLPTRSDKTQSKFRFVTKKVWKMLSS